MAVFSIYKNSHFLRVTLVLFTKKNVLNYNLNLVWYQRYI